MTGPWVRTDTVSACAPTGAAAILSHTRGAVLIEFAVLLMLIFGMTSYASWFLVANGVQQAANDGARAAIAGLDATERRDLATTRATGHLKNLGRYDMQRTTMAVSESAGQLTLTVSYDASRTGNPRLPFVPSPPSRVVQRATILLGGL